MEIIFYSEYPKKLEYIPEELKKLPGVVNIYCDYHILSMCNGYGRNRIAMLIEPRSIIPEVYSFIEKHWNEFLYVFTFDSKLLATLNNAKLFIYGVVNARFDPDKKTKNVSFVCSNKDMCDGHRNRRRLAEHLKGRIDTFGAFDGGSFAPAEDIYKPYRFNVAIENYSDGHYFTEKLCNCLANKVVPIYYGSPHIFEYFNQSGIIQAKNIDDIPSIIDFILNNNPETLYRHKLEAIEDNYSRVNRFACWEKNFFETYADLLAALHD